MSSDPFVQHQGLLFTVAYEMLGSAADAEDVVQETWLRWSDVSSESRMAIADQRAYLVRIATRLSLNRVRTLSRRKEDYVGEWLPEPLLTGPDVAEDVEFAERVSTAMLVVLETLSPIERAVFVLREVFDFPFDEVAHSVGKSTSAVRQIAHRARDRVAERRPRMQVSRNEQQQVIQTFMVAVQTGDTKALMQVLSPDVTMVADGGGVVQAVPRPVLGSVKVAALLSGFNRWGLEPEFQAMRINGGIAMSVHFDGKLDTVVSFAIEDGRITEIYAVRNPAKLAHMDSLVTLRRL